MNVTAKKLFGVLLLALIFTASPARAEAASVDGYLFYGATCPHCANEKKFCPMSFKKYPEFRLHQYEVYFNDKT